MVGFVDSSRARMAESRSERVVEAPCMAVPPEMATFVAVDLGFWAGDVPREEAGVVLRDRPGEIEARTLWNAGSRRAGVCLAAGVVDRENWLDMSFFREEEEDDGI